MSGHGANLSGHRGKFLGQIRQYCLLCISLRYLQLIFAVATRAICRPHIGPGLLRVKRERKIENAALWNLIFEYPTWTTILLLVKNKKMLISVRDDSSSIDFDMVDFENFNELTDSYEDADMEVENERMATYFLAVRTLTAVDNLAITGENIAENHASIWHQPQVEVPQKVRPVKPRGPCKRYTAHQIGKLYDIVIEEGKTAKEAALVTGINIRTAQHYIKKYNDDEERRLPVTVRKLGAGRKARLTEAHSQFLIEYVDKYPAAILSDITQNLCEAFPELSISTSALHRYLVQKCKLTLKKLEKLPVARNSDRVL